MGNRRGNSGNSVRLYFGGLQITADADCSHEIYSLDGKLGPTWIAYSKAETTLPTKVHLVKAMVFPVVMYGCESWTIKKLSTKQLMLLNCGVGEDS